MFHRMINEETLLASVAQEWNALVGAWAGAELEIGAEYGLSHEEPLALLGGALVPYDYVFGVSMLVTEPSTLVPHSLVIEKADIAVMEIGGTVETATELRQAFYTFGYLPSVARR